MHHPTPKRNENERISANISKNASCTTNERTSKGKKGTHAYTQTHTDRHTKQYMRFDRETLEGTLPNLLELFQPSSGDKLKGASMSIFCLVSTLASVDDVNNIGTLSDKKLCTLRHGTAIASCHGRNETTGLPPDKVRVPSLRSGYPANRTRN